MKIVSLIVLSALAAVVVSQVWVKKTVNNTEMHNYKVLQSFDDFEIRMYEAAVFSKVTLNVNSYKSLSGKGFGILAGYIFGDNERNEKIAMTSPVAMQIGESSTMKFMVPEGYSRENLPKPNNKDIEFEYQKPRVVAAVAFDGWADDTKIDKHKNLLSDLLAKHGILHTGKFEFLGYNPPFEITNRRNEVVVELVGFQL
jgi:hypothetical protein